MSFQDQLLLDKELRTSSDMVLMVSDAVSEMEASVLPELSQVAEFHNFLPWWILPLSVVIMTFLSVLMEETKTQVTCARPSPWEPMPLWLDVWLLVVRKAPVLHLTRTEDSSRCIEEWLDVIFYFISVGANISKMEKSGGEVNPQTFSAEGV